MDSAEKFMTHQFLPFSAFLILLLQMFYESSPNVTRLLQLKPHKKILSKEFEYSKHFAHYGQLS